MAASDHLSQQQGAGRFYHGTNAEFKPGDELTREGAWRALHPNLTAELDASRGSTGYHSPSGSSVLRLWPTNNDNHPVEDHLYYGDHSLLRSGESSTYGKHLYEVEHLTAGGRPSKSHKPDPNYTKEGMTGAYRTKGKLRVVGEVDSNGNRL